MRARGDASGSVFTADTIADKYGVVKGSYTSIALPATETYQVWAAESPCAVHEAVLIRCCLAAKVKPACCHSSPEVIVTERCSE